VNGQWQKPAVADRDHSIGCNPTCPLDSFIEARPDNTLDLHEISSVFWDCARSCFTQRNNSLGGGKISRSRTGCRQFNRGGDGWFWRSDALRYESRRLSSANPHPL